jgi:hypothetical protein
MLSTLLVVGGISLSACAGGPTPSYVLGYNSNLDGGWQCSAANAPWDVTDTSQFVSGCQAAAAQWISTFDDNSNGPFGNGNWLAIVPGNPKYKIPPIN